MEMTDIRAMKTCYSPELDFVDTCVARDLPFPVVGFLSHLTPKSWDYITGIDFRTGSHGQTVLHHMTGAFVLHGQTVTTPHSVWPLHRLDETQMIMLFPLSLSGATQRWFASLNPHDAGHGLI
ncbi:hypothetical protein CK203_060689 [Vitis vinifera]|uniref:Uncharacterized protein n=1 Tax=Vitis vinifera TaxID=29760 RepID=A0A438GA74_VITVI|nr:hypothetical protein CK203_060689 [Vitis vinifera]